MATVDLQSSVDMTAVADAAFATFAGASPGDYQWITPNNSDSLNITALSANEDITIDGTNLPLTGTIAAVTAANIFSGIQQYTITGLSVQLVDLIDPLSSIASHKTY